MFFGTHTCLFCLRKNCITPSHTFLSLSSAAGFSGFSAPPPPLSGGTQSNSVSTALKQLNICLESGPRTAFLLCCTSRTLNPSVPASATSSSPSPLHRPKHKLQSASSETRITSVASPLHFTPLLLHLSKTSYSGFLDRSSSQLPNLPVFLYLVSSCLLFSL